VCANLGIPLIVKTHNYVDLKYYKNVNCFIVTTEDQKKYLLTNGIKKEIIRIIPNFSSLLVREQLKAVNNPEPVIVSYGRRVNKKGFHILLKAFKAVIDSGYKAKLRIGGEGPEFNSLQNLCNELNLAETAELVGWVDDVENFLVDADVFILPSLDEPFGIVVLEAMAMGKPIISTQTRGPKEILDNNTAYFVEPDDVDALSDMLCHVINDVSGRQQKAECALDVYRDNYSKEAVVSRLLALYEDIADKYSDKHVGP
jgi:glycosyltransferase involved in cell wall biosynthesis